MTTKKTTKKTVKKSTEQERYIKVYFTDEGIGIDGKGISVVNHIEAVLAILSSLRQNDPELGAIKTCLDAIDYHRKTIKGRHEMIGHLERLRDALQEARKKAEAEAKKATKKTTKKK